MTGGGRAPESGAEKRRKLSGAWLGRAVSFTLEAAGEPPFDRRLTLPPSARGRWITLAYRGRPLARPLRPMLRMRRAGGVTQDFVLPGPSQGLAIWLGYLPPDLVELTVAAAPDGGFVIERVGLRRNAGLFAQCLLRRPLRVGPALYHFARGDERQFRDILRGSCAVTPRHRHTGWLAARTRHEPASPSATAIRLILPARPDEAAAVAATAASLLAQSHRAWELTIAWSGLGEAPPLSSDARVAHRRWPEEGRWRDLVGGCEAACLLSPGDRLSPDALGLLASALGGPQAPDLVYGDEETAEGELRLKPAWSPDLALALDYVGAPALHGPALLDRLGDLPLAPPTAFARALALAAITSIGHARHVPRILCRSAPRPAEDPAHRAASLTARLAAIGSPARAAVTGGRADLVWPLPDPAPLVSVVIPSKDRLDLIARVTKGVLEETGYPTIELVIVDNGSTDPGVLSFYGTLRADPRVRIAPFTAAFNFSAMVNAGAGVARGDILLLLNNDVAVLEPGWLNAMVAQACRPEVGAVGAKLLYENGRLQHAGVVVGLGGRAGHILRRRPADSPGRLGQLRVAHEVSAVTAACLAVRKSAYDAVGGFDAQAFPIDFNDVDFCLRLAATGLKTVWTPHAVLSHLESVSRGPPVGEARKRFEREADAFVERWRDTVRGDPFHHPALTLTTFAEDLE